MRQRGLDEGLFADFERLVESTGGGLELLDVEILFENKRRILRITIYKKTGVTLDDCVLVQNALGRWLDEHDPIPESYNLEVSSPGLERTLKRDKEFVLFRGSLCRANLFAPVDGKRSFQGVLLGLEKGPGGEQEVMLDTGQGAMAFPRKNVSKVQLVYDPKAPKAKG